jgi:hypothetical protein
VKAYFGQTRWNSADELADKENPVGIAQLRYAFVPCTATVTTNCDLNGNRLVDSPAELGAFNSTVGGAGFVTIDRGLKRPTNNEFSTDIEREIVQALSARVAYVYKNIRNLWGEVDTVRTPAYNVPFTINDLGADNIAGTADDQSFQSFGFQAGLASNRVYTNPEGNDADFHTVEFSLNRRFAGKWMLLNSFGYTWSKQQHVSTATTPIPTGYTRAYSYRPTDRLFGDKYGRETSTIWNYKLVGRYTMPFDVGASGSLRVQSGQQYGRTITVNVPGDGNRGVRVEPITAHRYDTVSIVDLRLDKSFRVPKVGKLTVQFDGFNLLNSNAITAFRQNSANNASAANLYREVTGILDPRIYRVGFRWDF